MESATISNQSPTENINLEISSEGYQSKSPILSKD
jgi:hypothetical protein